MAASALHFTGEGACTRVIKLSADRRHGYAGWDAKLVIYVSTFSKVIGVKIVDLSVLALDLERGAHICVAT
jgi:hypothetical protein